MNKIIRMTDAYWNKIKHFTPKEKWGDPYQMDYRLISEIDLLRKYIGLPIHIHCGYEPRDTGGFHPLGMAADLHIQGLSVIDQFITVSRFKFNGIGLYPKWNSPGLHLDIRPLKQHEPKSIWGCSKPGHYVPLTKQFIELCL